MFSGIYPDNLCGIRINIYSGIPSGKHSEILLGMFSHRLSGILTGRDCLSGTSNWHSIWRNSEILCGIPFVAYVVTVSFSNLSGILIVICSGILSGI